MTDVFREIEKSREAKFKLDEELRFKAECRRNRMLGQWAAEHMGLSGAKADAYAKALIRHNLDRPGSGSLVAKIVDDFSTSGAPLSQHDVVAAFERYHSLAVEQVARDFPRALDADHVQIGG